MNKNRTVLSWMLVIFVFLVFVGAVAVYAAQDQNIDELIEAMRDEDPDTCRNEARMLGAVQVRRHMRRRDWIEKLIKELKQRFGLEDCQCRGEASLERWVELVWLAYVLVAERRWAEKDNGRRRQNGVGEVSVTSWEASQRGIGHEVMARLTRDGLGLRVKRRLIRYLKEKESWLEPVLVLNGQLEHGLLMSV